MPYAKYTRERLAAAVAASTSMAGVLRHLGLGQNGGAHAHLRRRIDRLGIDTSHFLGRAHCRGVPSPRRRTPGEVLVVRPADAKRAAPPALRRALVESGRPYRCAACGGGATWQGRPLTLHVDHIDGRYWDCRPDNLRFLCPNCHSQTATYAGRNRSTRRIPVVRVDAHGDPIGDDRPGRPLTDAEKVDLLRCVDRREVTVMDAARRLGCHRNHVYALRRRLRERGSLAPAPRRPRIPADVGEAVVAFALRHPALGAKTIAAALARQPEPIRVSHGTVATMLKRSGLGTRAARAAAASTGSGPGGDR
ncbi:helix-turn-helix domain-containing protein [Jidongwangia harbinensis]|uniref:helix-turn-helix domain-containing protein n=1 Tax=Jidongwangia harbinensis TaxID=2878561 RepID=UPI001CD982AC|nr:helix-turn-helix domain-containing protein [Jidongwangia harbinensis]MCA2215431.1 helix-turn-helix domain-containing protein [Jidongwangia harbinensis]